MIIEIFNNEIGALNNFKEEMSCQALKMHDEIIFPNQINFKWNSVKEKSYLYKDMIEKSNVQTNSQNNVEHTTYNFEEKTKDNRCRCIIL
jgi:hypothetical protein